MYQLAAQWFWVFAEPGRVIVAALAVGIVLLWTPWARAGRWLASLGIAVLLMVSVFPVGAAMNAGLENRFPQIDVLPPVADGIIVLGGATQRAYVISASVNGPGSSTTRQPLGT